jgi:ParB family chromosome partitioning protein
MAPPRRRKTGVYSRATEVAEVMTEREQAAPNVLQMITTVPLEQIQVPTDRTRPLNVKHVQELLESIAAVGLGQPLITDRAHRLIAGGHRYAALQRLQSEQVDVFKQHFPHGLIPIRVYDFDALVEPERSEQIEIAENEKRRDYTAAEVKALAQKYLEQGYTQVSHRPKSGEKPLIPALQTYFRLSRRTIHRYLSNADQSHKELSVPCDTLTPRERKITGYIHSLKQIRSFLSKEKLKGTRSIDHVITQLEQLLGE